jgi:DNA-directed RNA polymerase specialized sigma24 family protein
MDAQQVMHVVAKKLASRNRWRFPRDTKEDVLQEAWLCVVAAMRDFDAERGELSGFLRTRGDTLMRRTAAKRARVKMEYHDAQFFEPMSGRSEQEYADAERAVTLRWRARRERGVAKSRAMTATGMLICGATVDEAAGAVYQGQDATVRRFQLVRGCMSLQCVD